jgi:hypothetical protein
LRVAIEWNVVVDRLFCENVLFGLVDVLVGVGVLAALFLTLQVAPPHDVGHLVQFGLALVRIFQHFHQHFVHIVFIFVFKRVFRLDPELVLDPFWQLLEVRIRIVLTLPLVNRVDEGIGLVKTFHCDYFGLNCKASYIFYQVACYFKV